MSKWSFWEEHTYMGHVAYLYQISLIGKRRTTTIGYCTGKEPISWKGQTYIPYPCAHGELTSDLEDVKGSISFAANQMWIDILITNMPNKIKVVVTRYKHDIAQGKVIFVGNMNSFDLTKNVFKLDCSSSFAAANSDMITYYTQRHCNHEQYGYYCGLNFDTYKLPLANYTMLDRRTIQIDASLDSKYWANFVLIYSVSVPVTMGDWTHTVEYDLENIAANMTGNIATLKYPLSLHFPKRASAIEIAPNCNLSLVRCRDHFGNLPRATAWPDMPLQNYTAADATQCGKGRGGPLFATGPR